MKYPVHLAASDGDPRRFSPFRSASYTIMIVVPVSLVHSRIVLQKAIACPLLDGFFSPKSLRVLGPGSTMAMSKVKKGFHSGARNRRALPGSHWVAFSLPACRHFGGPLALSLGNYDYNTNGGKQ
jgi:hypothetical protein